MSITTGTVTWTHRTWNIVSADLDMSHVFLPDNSITFKLDELDGIPGYRLANFGDKPAPDCFRDTFLVAVGDHQPLLRCIAKNQPLPLFTRDVAQKYNDVSDEIPSYIKENPQTQHLEGKIKIPCHADPAQLKAIDAEDHEPLLIDVPIQVYQFANAVEGGRPLLVLRTPLERLCPMNGNGTVYAYP